jgi:hypothetical protein
MLHTHWCPYCEAHWDHNDVECEESYELECSDCFNEIHDRAVAQHES